MLLVSFAKSVNTPESFSDFTILILSISPFEINKVNRFSAVTASRPLTFLSNLSNIDKVALVTNLGKTSLVKRVARSISAFWLNYPSYYLTSYQEIHLIELF